MKILSKIRKYILPQIHPSYNVRIEQSMYLFVKAAKDMQEIEGDLNSEAEKLLEEKALIEKQQENISKLYEQNKRNQSKINAILWD